MSMVYTPLFTSSLMSVPSRLFRSATTLPACTTFLIEIKGFTTFALLNFVHLCTPSTDLDGMVFSPKSSVFSPFHSREHLCWHDKPSSSCVHSGSDVHAIVIDFNDFPWRRARNVFDTRQCLMGNFSSSSILISCWLLILALLQQTPRM